MADKGSAGWLKEKPYLLSLGLLGLLFLVLGVAGMVIMGDQKNNQIEILEVVENEAEAGGEVWVDVSGAVINPGVYQFDSGARVNEALALAGGLALEADRDWVSKNINLAQKLSDGVKIYIPFKGEASTKVSQSSGVVAGIGIGDKVNVNTASVSQLDELWGIGPATAEKIISNRPYSSVEELLTKKVLKSNVYETNKDKLSVF